MKRLAIIFAICAAVLTGCSGSVKDIKVTGCELVSVVPMGLYGLDAVVDVTVDNPTISFEVTGVVGTVKYKGDPCLTLTADGILVDGRCEKTYTVPVKGSLSDNFNPFTLLKIFNAGDFGDCTLDVRAKVALKNGIGKVIEKKDIPVKELIDKI